MPCASMRRPTIGSAGRPESGPRVSAISWRKAWDAGNGISVATISSAQAATQKATALEPIDGKRIVHRLVGVGSDIGRLQELGSG